MWKQVRRPTLAVIAGAIAVGAGTPLAAQQLTPIGVSYQPAVYWAVPYYIATEKGWWKEAGLEPKFTTFASGAPQVAAAASKSWDVGGTGSAPAVLGSQRFNILTIGITNDESAGNAVMARSNEAAGIAANPSSLKGKQLLVTTNSTGEYAAVACLKKWGLGPKDMQVVNLNQQEIISAFATGTGGLAAVWAPNIYTLEERTGSKVICSGKEANAIIPGALVVRRDFAEQNPDKVAAYLAVYLRAVTWQKAHREETIKMMKTFYEKSGVILPEKYLAREIDTRPTYGLDEQLKLLAGAKSGDATVDKWFKGLGDYLVSTGTLKEAPKGADFITSVYMERVAADPNLKAFAEGK
jgi:ABC-type nitrate/sulfonate/bicarbonate transport system substrate-binding protein